MKNRITTENKKGDKVMKTNLNVQKAVTKTLAAGISLVLISITVNAQDFWKSVFENSSFNTIATAMVVSDLKTTKAESIHFADAGLAVEAEEPLELESWMMEESTFNTSLTVETEAEAPLSLESWMTREDVFEADFFNNEKEAENALELESWMTNDSNFENTAIEIIEETEEPLELENWMLEDHFEINREQEQPLRLESWMTSEQTWVV
jgi:hypothetical protein